MKNYISCRYDLPEIFKLFPPNEIIFLSRGRIMSIAASISHVESLPNMFGGARANDRDHGLPHETPSGPNYSIHRSPKGCNLDRLAATYLEASNLAHYHPGTQV